MTPVDDDWRRIGLWLETLQARRILAEDPTAAVVATDAAITSALRIGHDATLPELYLLRGRAHLALGHNETAESDLEQALALVMARRSRIDDEALRVGFFDTKQETIDTLIGFHAFTRRDPARAFDVAENGRARALDDRVRARRPASAASHHTRPDHLARAQQQLEDDRMLIAYAVLEDRVLIWAIRHDSLTFKSVPWVRADLEHQIVAFRRAIEEGFEAAGRRLGRDLYRRLVEPLAAHIREQDELILLPDRMLHRLPWAALVVDDLGRYLVEDHALAVLPSLSVGRDRSISSAAASTQQPILVVGDPRRPDLLELPAAGREAAEVAHFYGAQPLIGEGASREVVLAALPKARMAHLAVHGEMATTFLEPSRLRLTSTAADPAAGDLTDAAIAKLNLEALDLEFLSACDTVDGFADASREGILGMARAFLGAGARTVVASAWLADDQAAYRLAVAFHRARISGLDGARALASAQRAMIASNQHRSPVRWAGFQVYGWP